MEGKDNFSANFPGLDYTNDHHQQLIMRPEIGETSANNGHRTVDYMINNPPQHHMASPGLFGSNSLDKLSFADVMQFADFGSKLGLNQTKVVDEDDGIDPVYFLKFPVLNDKLQDESNFVLPQNHDQHYKKTTGEEIFKTRLIDEEGEGEKDEGSENYNLVQLGITGEKSIHAMTREGKNNTKRKRPRSVKTSEEVESQRMTHIAVERNRRKQMNEHLRVLRSLMPGSYVQRGDQASIIGGAIEFVRELEQLLQCLESQKRRRLYGDAPPQPVGDPSLAIPQHDQPPFLPPLLIPVDDNQLDFELGLRDETAQSKSCLADIEVKLLGFDAIVKILSRRRPGQLIKLIAALEDLQLAILHTNITTIEQTVLYSFNIKVAGEVRFTAEDIASSVQQIFSFINANSGI